MIIPKLLNLPLEYIWWIKVFLKHNLRNLKQKMAMKMTNLQDKWLETSKPTHTASMFEFI